MTISSLNALNAIYLLKMPKHLHPAQTSHLIYKIIRPNTLSTSQLGFLIDNINLKYLKQTPDLPSLSQRTLFSFSLPIAQLIGISFVLVVCPQILESLSPPIPLHLLVNSLFHPGCFSESGNILGLGAFALAVTCLEY